LTAVRTVVVLGSTGSIGRNALDVIARQPDRLELVGVAAHSQVEMLARQADAFRAPLVSVWDSSRAEELARLGYPGALVGLEGLIALATDPRVDTVLFATSGRDALVPLIRAIQAGKRIALASKELLVMAGSLIMRLVREHGTTLIPVDSEHAGLFQCLRGVPPGQVRRLAVTGSGGPLLHVPQAQLATVTQAQVLNHPKWRMGRKITVDSATLMNKGLEVIEAHRLFDVALDRLSVLIHPEAVVHALVELVDGTWLAQLSACDMRLPIQYALGYPDRWEIEVPRLEPTQLSALRFLEPDLERFPCLRLALNAVHAGESACIVLNGANEQAVAAYLEGQIAFTDIPHVIEDALAHHTAVAQPTLDQILMLDDWSRQTAKEFILQCSPG
jgi:1-deoxy-D-xylulose-5-phosphate reductoisomerase